MAKKLNRKRQVTMTVGEIEKMKRNATNNAIKLTNFFPLWVLRNEFGFGRIRLERYMEGYIELMDSYNKDYLDLQDIAQALRDETGVDWDDMEKKEDE